MSIRKHHTRLNSVDVLNPSDIVNTLESERFKISNKMQTHEFKVTRKVLKSMTKVSTTMKY